jgi:hypothetical protein
LRDARVHVTKAFHAPVVRDALEQLLCADAHLNSSRPTFVVRNCWSKSKESRCVVESHASSMCTTTLNSEPPDATLLTSAYGLATRWRVTAMFRSAALGAIRSIA